MQSSCCEATALVPQRKHIRGSTPLWSAQSLNFWMSLTERALWMRVIRGWHTKTRFIRSILPRQICWSIAMTVIEESIFPVQKPRNDPRGCVFRAPDNDMYFNDAEEGKTCGTCHHNHSCECSVGVRGQGSRSAYQQPKIGALPVVLRCCFLLLHSAACSARHDCFHVLHPSQAERIQPDASSAGWRADAVILPIGTSSQALHVST